MQGTIIRIIQEILTVCIRVHCNLILSSDFHSALEKDVVWDKVSAVYGDFLHLKTGSLKKWARLCQTNAFLSTRVHLVTQGTRKNNQTPVAHINSSSS
jgi:hypothetical protein